MALAEMAVVFFYLADLPGHQYLCHNQSNQHREADLARSLWTEHDWGILQMVLINRILQ